MPVWKNHVYRPGFQHSMAAGAQQGFSCRLWAAALISVERHCFSKADHARQGRSCRNCGGSGPQLPHASRQQAQDALEALPLGAMGQAEAAGP